MTAVYPLVGRRPVHRSSGTIHIVDDSRRTNRWCSGSLPRRGHSSIRPWTAAGQQVDKGLLRRRLQGPDARARAIQ